MQHYYPNQVVKTPDGYGRVIHHNWFTHLASVIRKVSDKTWVVTKYDESKIEPAEVFLWSTGQAFKSNYVSYVQFYKY